MSLAHDPPATDAQPRSVVGNQLLHGHAIPDAHRSRAVENPLAGGQTGSAPHSSLVPGNPLPATSAATKPMSEPSRDDLPPAHDPGDSQRMPGGGDLASDQKSRGAQAYAVAGDLDGSHVRSDTHTGDAPVDLAEGHKHPDTHPRRALGDLETFHVQLNAAVLDDLESVRKAVGNRLRAAEANGLPVIQYAAHLALLEQVEHQATLDLQRALRKHPLGGWVKTTVGIGEKQGARLLAAIGDPAWNHAEDRPRRGPAELWAYCGYAPDQKRQKGVKSNWNAEAKMRAHLCAKSCIKQMHSPYRPAYDAARLNWQDRDTSDLHKHNHALRVVAKEILRDLFIEARALRGDA